MLQEEVNISSPLDLKSLVDQDNNNQDNHLSIENHNHLSPKTREKILSQNGQSSPVQNQYNVSAAKIDTSIEWGKNTQNNNKNNHFEHRSNSHNQDNSPNLFRNNIKNETHDSNVQQNGHPLPEIVPLDLDNPEESDQQIVSPFATKKKKRKKKGKAHNRPSEEPLIHLTDEDSWEANAQYFEDSLPMAILYWSLVVLSLGSLLVIVKWYPQLYLLIGKKSSNKYEGNWVRIKSTNLDDSLDHVCRIINVFQERFFEYKCDRYFWDTTSLRFVKKNFNTANLTFAEIHEKYGQGATTKMIQAHSTLYGDNSIKVPVPSYFHLAVNEALHPFYVFQILSLILWWIDNYRYYAIIIGVSATIAASISVYTTRKNLDNLSDLAKVSQTVEVLRDGRFQTVDSDNLVPGDVIKIETGTAPCDCIVLDGELVVNESMLTGESFHVLKSSISKTDTGSVYNPESDSSVTLYGGTRVLHLKSSQTDSPVLGLVYSTGFQTSKGFLIKSLLYPKPTNFRFYSDSFKFIGALSIVALIGMAYSIYLYESFGSDLDVIIIRSFDLITIVVPPSLPIAMTMGTTFAISRLKLEKIFCISPTRINVGGKVDQISFDKTGTLTEEGLDVLGVQEVVPNAQKKTVFTGLEKNQDKLSTEMNWALGVCHSLARLNNEFVGDILEVKMFEWIKWKYTEVSSSIYGGSVRLNEPNSDVDFIQVKRFDFSASLKRMSVLIQNFQTKELTLCVKGAPEVIASLCVPSSIPPDFNIILPKLAFEGYRILAIATRSMNGLQSIENLQREDAEKQLRFLGLLILENKLKPDTVATMKLLNKAELKNVMVTGDHPLTSIHIGKACELFSPNTETVYLGTLQSLSDDEPVLRFKLIDEQNPGKDFYVDTLSVLSSDEAELALTGPAFSFITKKHPELLEKILEKTRVFARMSPSQKAELVTTFQTVEEKVTAMTGDGANDCGALKAADIGLSLSEEEASIAAPFSSQVFSISSMVTLLKECRCSLVSSTQIFKFMALYSIVQFVSVLLCYRVQARISDFQFLWIDLFLNLIIAPLMAMTKPADELTVQRPVGSLISGIVLFSVIGHTIICISFQIIAFLLLENSDVFEQPDIVPGIEPPPVTQTGTVIFTFANFQYIFLVFALSGGAPFRKNIFTNYYLSGYLLFLAVINTTMILFPPAFLQYLFDLTDLPFSLKVELFFLAVINGVLIFGLEHYLLSIIVEKYKHLRDSIGNRFFSDPTESE